MPHCGAAQISLWSDEFNGGVVTGAYSVGTIDMATSGSFSVNIPAGSTIHKAWFLAGQCGNAAPVTVQLNTIGYTFDTSNQVGIPFNSLYGGTSWVHAIDVTADLSPLTSLYTIDVPYQSLIPSDRYPDFYLFIAYANPGYAPVAASVYTNDLDAALFMEYTLSTAYPLHSAEPVAFAVMAGYAAATPTDCEYVRINGIGIGDYRGPDQNAVSNFGACGTFEYANSQLNGLLGDDGDQLVANADVLSNIQALVPDQSTSLAVQFEHCPGGTDGDNHIWAMFLVNGTDPCSATLELGPDALLCEVDSLVLDASMPGSTYLWQDGSTDATFTVNDPGSFWVTVQSADCVWQDTITISPLELPQIDLGNDTSICAGQELLLQAPLVVDATYMWQDGSVQPQFQALVEGDHWVTLSVEGCSVSDSMHLSVLSLPTVDLGNDTTICAGTSVTLTAPMPGGSTLWHDGSTGTSLTVSDAGLYWAMVDSNGCTATDTVAIDVAVVPDTDLPDAIELCANEVVLLDATSDDGTYLWQDGSTAGTLQVSQPGTYWVTFTVNGCTYSDTTLVTVGGCVLVIDLPNVFSPNTDDFNEVFAPIKIFGVASLEVTVYNRWGQPVFSSSDVNFRWNGRTQNHDEVPEGVYYWSLVYTGKLPGVKGALHGAVTLLR